jgi:hypothetical protein
MRLITTTDDELYEAVRVAVRLGRAKPLVDRLNERYQEGWDDPDVSFHYALAVMATLHTVQSDVEGHRCYNATMEALGDVLSAAPDHWLARYCRARLRALVPTGFSAYTMFVEHERTMANEDLKELAARQSGVPWQPYFAATHLQQAFVASQAEDWPAVVELIDQAGAHPPAAVGFRALGAMLCEPFLALYHVVDLDRREVVGGLMAAMFPNQAAVTAALAQAVR